MTRVLFHVSDRSDITRFEPRPSRRGEPRVWAVSEKRLCNYLLPRECPRVTYFATETSSTEDIATFDATPAGTIAVESDWLARILMARLFVYRLPDAGFEIDDETAGYHVSRDAVAPEDCTAIVDAPAAIAARGAALLLLQSLWPLHDAVAASTLGFSMIRMRNASAR